MRTSVVLPGEFVARAPEPTDAEGIFELLSAYNTTVAGVADCTLADVADALVEPGFERTTDGFLVVGGDGKPAGYATAFAKGHGRDMIEIEVASPHQAVAAWLFDQTIQRAAEMGREGGHAEVTVDSCVFRADESLRVLMADHDFTACTTYNRMRIDHSKPVAIPEVPAGVVVHRGAYGADAQWIAHEVLLECFRGQFNFVPRPHDEWVQYRDTSSTLNWSQLTTLEVDGRAVAIRICSDEFLAADDCGYVGMLGVVEEFRDRGLAKFLLLDAFAADAAAGRIGTILNVDTNNPTPALGLYLSVGMTPTLVLDGWRTTLPVG